MSLFVRCVLFVAGSGKLSISYYGLACRFFDQCRQIGFSVRARDVFCGIIERYLVHCRRRLGRVLNDRKSGGDKQTNKQTNKHWVCHPIFPQECSTISIGALSSKRK